MKHTTPIGVPPQAPQEEAEPEEELDVTEEEEEEEEEDDEDVDAEADEEDDDIDEGAMQPCASAALLQIVGKHPKAFLPCARTAALLPAGRCKPSWSHLDTLAGLCCAPLEPCEAKLPGATHVNPLSSPGACRWQPCISSRPLPISGCGSTFTRDLQCCGSARR